MFILRKQLKLRVEPIDHEWNGLMQSFFHPKGERERARGELGLCEHECITVKNCVMNIVVRFFHKTFGVKAKIDNAFCVLRETKTVKHEADMWKHSLT